MLSKLTGIACSLLATESFAVSYYSGATHTNEEFQYGKFVTSMKTGNHYGTVASFFTYWTGPHWSVGQWNEIDVEIVPSVQQQGKSPFSTNIIYGDGHNSKREEQQYVTYNHDWTQFHTYEIEWTPEYISWAVDGKTVRKTYSKDSAGVRFTNKSQKLEMNFWTPTWNSWGGGRNDHDMPWYVYYDYVEVYAYDHATKGFHRTWRDDFNSLDRHRWAVSDGATFESNSSMFVQNHVYIWEGALCLKMAKSRSDTIPWMNYGDDIELPSTAKMPEEEVSDVPSSAKMPEEEVPSSAKMPVEEPFEEHAYERLPIEELLLQ